MDKYKTWELTLKTFFLIGGIATAVWAYFTYTDTKEKEFYTFYWNQKLELFLETSQAASTMATTGPVQEFLMARSKYWELFYGRLSLVEGDTVKNAMEEFSRLVPSGSTIELNQIEFPRKELQQPAYNLTIALKQDLLSSWKDPFSELESGAKRQN